MKKFHLLGLALFAMCAFGAILSASAFALEFVLAEWLEGGNPITTSRPMDTIGELLWENTANGSAYLCSLLFEGTVGPDGVDTITKVVTLGGVQVGELVGKGIMCTGEKLCETGTEIWLTKLPINTLLEIDTSDGKWWDLMLNGEYHMLCKTFLGNVEETCVVVSGSGAEVLNVAGGVEPSGSFEPNSTCNGTANVGLITADTGGLMTIPGGGVLSVSS